MLFSFCEYYFENCAGVTLGNLEVIRERYPKLNILKCLVKQLRYRFDPYSRILDIRSYLYYGFDIIDNRSKKDYMFLDEIEAMERALNQDSKRDIFNNKELFYTYFREFMNRKILFARRIQFDEFNEFVSSQKRIVIKPMDQYGGHGFDVIYSHNFNENELHSLYERLRDNNYVIEEYIENHSDYSKIYPNALNTIRVYTLLDGGESPNIFCVINQWGSRGSITDNDEYKAIWTQADIETGKTINLEMNYDDFVVHKVHPDTRENLSAFCNVKFGEVKELAIEAAKIIPECRIIGWDIAVTKNGNVELIEGNVTPELMMLQAIIGKGLKKIFDEI